MFASPAPVEIEEVVYESADLVSGHGPAFFVTVLTRHEARERATRESHVFLPGENLHLHEIAFIPLSRDESDASVAEAVRATHGLFAARVAERAGGQGRAGGGEGAGLIYATRRTEESPFHEFRLRGWFPDAMWEIQDWTVSAVLREALGRVTRYRADAGEAELLRRMFAGG